MKHLYMIICLAFVLGACFENKTVETPKYKRADLYARYLSQDNMYKSTAVFLEGPSESEVSHDPSEHQIQFDNHDMRAVDGPSFKQYQWEGIDNYMQEVNFQHDKETWKFSLPELPKIENRGVDNDTYAFFLSRALTDREKLNFFIVDEKGNSITKSIEGEGNTTISVLESELEKLEKGKRYSYFVLSYSIIVKQGDVFVHFNHDYFSPEQDIKRESN